MVHTRTISGLTTFVLVALVLVPEVRAQAAHPGGLWLGLGLGGGLSTSSEFSGSGRWGEAFYARVGGTLSQRAQLGAEFIAWTKQRTGGKPARGNISLVALLYPTQAAPVFLKGGAGLAVAALLRQAPAGGITTRNAQGLGLSAGAGAHLRLGRSASLTPNLDVLYQYFPAGQDPSLANFVILGTLGLTFR